MGHTCGHFFHSDNVTNIGEAMSICNLDKESGCSCNKKAEVEGDSLSSQLEG